MKITKRLVVFTVFHILFCAIAPIAFIFIEYGFNKQGLVYKIPLAGVMLLLAVMFAAKHTFLKPAMDKLTAQMAQHEADLKIEADAARIANLEKELKRERTIYTVINALIPILLFGAGLIACKAMEAAILKLSGAIGFSLVSYLLGTIFGVLAAREVHGKHKKLNED